MVEDALCPNGCKSIIDTGTYLIYGPSDQLQTFLADMTIKGCEEKHKLPNLGFMFKGYSKNGKDTAFELVLTPDDYVLEFEVDGKNDCVVGIGSDNEDSGWTLGQVFLKTYYTVFDRDNEAIGFVKSNPNPHEFTKKASNVRGNHNLALQNNSFLNNNNVNTDFSTFNSTPGVGFNANSFGMYDMSNLNSNSLPNGPLKADDSTIVGAMNNSFLR
jgi:hypothetical protein